MTNYETPDSQSVVQR